MKRIIPFLTASLMAVPCIAEKKLCVVIYEKQGQTAAFDLEQRPSVSFCGNDVRLVCCNTDVLYPLENYLKMTIQEADTETLAEKTMADASFSVSENEITAHGCDSMSLYTVDGKLITTAQADENGTATLATSQLGKGVYLVKTGNNAFKITKK